MGVWKIKMVRYKEDHSGSFRIVPVGLEERTVRK
jgi:hypothetical protein